ncbi:hypothetical protein MNBD_UNCLBAC01-1336 [hydrothermal vent metagenome]|uniref:Polymerase nucleotidyl transferase domain-containing protein n=1 Tax=hydrothermal vent metagenome TaxID=652676 RepID=A0A3B1E5D1_9ZZZZ
MAQRTILKALDRKKINAFLELLDQRKVKVSRAIIFGSHAKGKAGKDSDIDIAVVSKQFGKDSLKEMFMLREIALKIDSQIEPIPLTPQDFKDQYSTLIQEINQYGVDYSIVN